MKFFYCLLFLLLTSTFLLQGQNTPLQDTITPGKGNANEQLKEIKKEKEELHSDSTGSEPKKIYVDTTVQNKYGDLLNDDTTYNKKYSLWRPIGEVFGVNALTFGVDRYIGKFDFSVPVGFNSWKHNLKTGWEWDTDRFGINFIGHPYSGTLTFNAARSNGYSFWESAPFAVGGSLMWEYFGENTLPSYNDIINTPVNGIFLGEIFYRISSTIIDDRARGFQRFLRELAAGIIDPSRGFNRLIQGKSFRKLNKEVYQKEPLNLTLYSGYEKVNEATHDNVFLSGKSNQIINLQIDYGNPFENRPRKPFDFFKVRVETRFGDGRKNLDNITGYGILTGRNYQADSGKRAMLIGLYQYYDYWDNKTFELGAVGIGGGIITRLELSGASKSNIYTSLHLEAIPFAGNSTQYGPDTSQFRDYNFGGGLGGKLEVTANFGTLISATFITYYNWIHSYVGLKEDNFISITKPKIAVRVVRNLSVGFEQAFYNNAVHSPGIPVVNLARTEQRFFLMLYLEDKQRRGHYD